MPSILISTSPLSMLVVAVVTGDFFVFLLADCTVLLLGVGAGDFFDFLLLSLPVPLCLEVALLRREACDWEEPSV